MPLTKVSSGVIAANAVVDSFGTQSITGDKLGLTAINANNIVGGAVTGDKIGLTAINANNIVDGAVTVSKGGTGLSTLTANSILIGNGTSSPQFIAPGTSANVLTSNGTNWTSSAPAAGGKVLQVVSAVKTNTFVTSSGSYVDVPGLSVTITPTSATSNVFVLFQVNGSQEVGAGRATLRLVRGATVINAGDAAGSRTPALGGFGSPDQSVISATVSGSFLDSPATTSSTTYKIQAAMPAGSGDCYINRTMQDGDTSSQLRTASTITVMEIAV